MNFYSHFIFYLLRKILIHKEKQWGKCNINNHIINKNPGTLKKIRQWDHRSIENHFLAAQWQMPALNTPNLVSDCDYTMIKFKVFSFHVNFVSDSFFYIRIAVNSLFYSKGSHAHKEVGFYFQDFCYFRVLEWNIVL